MHISSYLFITFFTTYIKRNSRRMHQKSVRLTTARITDCVRKNSPFERTKSSQKLIFLVRMHFCMVQKQTARNTDGGNGQSTKGSILRKYHTWLPAECMFVMRSIMERQRLMLGEVKHCNEQRGSNENGRQQLTIMNARHTVGDLFRTCKKEKKHYA